MENLNPSVLISGASFLLALVTFLSNRRKASNERTEAMEKRILHLETLAEAAPNHGDLAKVYEALNTLAATVNQLVGENRGQTDTLRLILNQIAQKGMA